MLFPVALHQSPRQGKPAENGFIPVTGRELAAYQRDAGLLSGKVMPRAG